MLILLIRTMESYRVFYKKCVVPGCTDLSSKRHSFPKRDHELFDKWVEQVGNALLRNKTREQIYSSYRVCDLHFPDHDRVPGTLRGLKKGAVPTLHLPTSLQFGDECPEENPQEQTNNQTLSNTLAKSIGSKLGMLLSSRSEFSMLEPSCLNPSQKNTYAYLRKIMLQGEGRTEDNGNSDEKESGEMTVTEEIPNGSQLKHPKAKSVKRKIPLPPNIDQKMDEAYKVFKNVTDIQMSPPDGSSLYGELLATKLRALDTDTREIAMIEIDLLVYHLKHRYNESSKQHFGHVNLQNVPIQSTASFPHNSNQYQPANFEPVVQHTLSRPPSSASSHHSMLSNH